MAEISAFPKGSFPTYTWPALTWPLAIVLVPFDFAEIWDGQVVMNLAVTAGVRMNRIVAAQVVINKEVTDSYSELEAI
jgi:hypothetical protein